MKKNKMFFISIAGIAIIFIALLGFSYGFFLTRINGNTNTNSILATSSDLSLKYEEGQNSNIELEDFEPGVKASKTFSVTNDGDSTVSSYGVYLEDIVNTFSRTEDLDITLTCVASKGTEDLGSCGSISNDYPTVNTRLLINSIDPDVTHTYTFTLEYVYLDDVNQSEDMGKTLGGKIQIYAESDVATLEGIVTGATEGDYILLESDNKTSQINLNDNSYILTGVGVGSHTIKVMNKSSNGTITTKGSKEIIIRKAQEARYDADTKIIYIDENTEKVPIEIVEIKTSLTLTTGKPIETTLTDRILAYYGGKHNISEVNKNYVSEIVLGNYNEQMLVSDYYNEDKTLNEEYSWYIWTDTAWREPFSYQGKYTIYNYKLYTIEEIDINYNVTLREVFPTVFDRETKANEGGMYRTIDDYGTTYYFRGDIKNNYVQFGYEGDKPIYWRIVRINGDNSVRLIYAGNELIENENTSIDQSIGETTYIYYNDPNFDSPPDYGSNGLGGDYEESYISLVLNNWYRDNLFDNYREYISDSYFCNRNGYDDLSVYSPSLICEYTEDKYTVNDDSGNKKLTYPIGLITADEIMYAGYTSNSNYLNNKKSYFTMTIMDSDKIYFSNMSTDNVYYSSSVRPVINLKYETYASGAGTISNPYVIKIK